MPHVPRDHLHAFLDRAVDVRVDIDTDRVAGDFSSITFECGALTKAGLAAVAGGSGVIVDFILTAANAAVIGVGVIAYELYATVAGEVRSVARGHVTVELAPSG